MNGHPLLPSSTRRLLDHNSERMIVLASTGASRHYGFDRSLRLLSSRWHDLSLGGRDHSYPLRSRKLKQACASRPAMFTTRVRVRSERCGPPNRAVHRRACTHAALIEIETTGSFSPSPRAVNKCRAVRKKHEEKRSSADRAAADGARVRLDLRTRYDNRFDTAISRNLNEVERHRPRPSNHWAEPLEQQCAPRRGCAGALLGRQGHCRRWSRPNSAMATRTPHY